MVNKSKNTELDEIIKQTLSDIEAPSLTSDWSQMEKLLDAAPQSNSFKYKHELTSFVESIKDFTKSNSLKWVFSPYFFIFLAIVAGAFLLHNRMNLPVTDENTTNLIAKDTIIADPSKSITPQVLPKDVLNTNNKKQLPKDSMNNQISTSDKNSLKSEEIKSDKKENTLIEESEEVKTDNKKDLKKKEQISKKENFPVSKDSRDSANGVSEGNNQSDNSVGRNNFLLYNINSDSIKKLQNQQPKDSLK